MESSGLLKSVNQAGAGFRPLNLAVLEGAGRLLALLALEERFQGDQLPEDTADGPNIDGRCVVLGTQQQLRRSVPDCHHHPIA